jgi:hypothetical protein
MNFHVSILGPSTDFDIYPLSIKLTVSFTHCNLATSPLYIGLNAISLIYFGSCYRFWWNLIYDTSVVGGISFIYSWLNLLTDPNWLLGITTLWSFYKCLCKSGRSYRSIQLREQSWIHVVGSHNIHILYVIHYLQESLVSRKLLHVKIICWVSIAESVVQPPSIALHLVIWIALHVLRQETGVIHKWNKFCIDSYTHTHTHTHTKVHFSVLVV